jgi:hypothetical protein
MIQAINYSTKDLKLQIQYENPYITMIEVIFPKKMNGQPKDGLISSIQRRE